MALDELVIIPDADVLALVADLATVIDGSNQYSRVVIEHEALHGLLDPARRRGGPMIDLAAHFGDNLTRCLSRLSQDCALTLRAFSLLPDIRARFGRRRLMRGDGRRWQELFGLQEREPTPAPPGRPGHSMSGRVVTGEPVDWSRYDDCMRLNVVGESFYQDALVRVSKCPPTGEHGYECSAELVRDPDNPHDKNAIRVEVDGEHVGHLPRGSAKRFNRRLHALEEEGKRAICMAYIGRAPDGEYLGISLRIPYDGEILQGKR